MISPIRLSGIASGLDTEKIIQDLMRAERMPVDRLKKQKQLEEWKRDAYREMNSLLLELQTTVDSLRFASSFNKKIASSENDAIVAAKVTGAPKMSSYSIEVQQLAKAEMPAAVQFAVDASITSSSQQIGGNAFTFEIDTDDDMVADLTVNVDPTDTIDDVINQINSANIDLEAFFIDNKLVIQSKTGADMGADKQFTVTVTGDGSKLGMVTTTSTAKQDGQSAQVVINGITHTFTGNTFTYDGVEFTVKQTNVGAPISVGLKTDEDAVFNMIKGFVDKYNEVIDKINKKISEPKYKGYEPLTDEEKEALPESTAEKLENMAKSGILLRDSILKSGLDQMRYAIAAPLQAAGVDAAFDTLAEIGIGGPPSGKYAYMENGKLYIDETKLREAIRNNGDKVAQLFTNYSSNADPAIKYKESGIAERLYDELSKTINDITKKAGSTTMIFDDSVISRNIQRIDEEIDRWEDRLQKIEDRYWKQFTAMEQAMARAQSQSVWFAQLLGQQQ